MDSGVNSSPFVQIMGVTKKFGAFTAVDNISLDILKGEFFSLLGPSGCGKTTLLRMLAGFETPTSGRILIDGEDMSAVPPHKRPVNMMFQSYALFPHMNVEQNIAFGLKQDKMVKSEVQDRTRQILQLVKMADFAKRKPNQLSGGQKQRIALARALVKQPKMLLLDEPLGALDKKLREETQFELVNIQEELGITFVIVTHDQEEAMTVSSRIAMMDHGHIAQVANPAEIYEFPNSRNVAEFIGDVNILPGRIEGAAIRLHDGSLVQANQIVDVENGAEVFVALRPEKLVVSKDTLEAAASNCLAGEVWDIGYLGKLSIYHIRLDNGDTITVAQTNRQRGSAQAITWEDRVYVTWSPDATVVLKE